MIYKTIYEVVKESVAYGFEESFWYYFGDFLDYFYNIDTSFEDRVRAITAEPLFDRVSDKDKAFIAASVHKLAIDYSLPRPEWIFDKQYFLKEPYFSNNAKGELRLVLLAESPLPFRIRNIYTSENTLSRV